MIDLNDVLLMPVAAGLSNQLIRRDGAVVVVADSCRSALMPSAAQVAVERSSAGKRLQTHAAEVNAVDAKSIDDEMTHLRVDAHLGFSVSAHAQSKLILTSRIALLNVILKSILVIPECDY